MTSSESFSSSNDCNRQRAFATTSWSIVLKATENDTDAGTALNLLCESYWYPLYAFARQKGKSSSQAEDVTQAFFVELLAKDRLEMADQSRGRFRTFLLASFTNFMSNQWRADQAIKRGGGQKLLSLDFENADKTYSDNTVAAGTTEETPESIFERAWALTLLEQANQQVRAQYELTGKLELFEAIESFLGGGRSGPTYAEVAEKLGMKEGAIKVAVHRLRERYGEQLRMQIARTVDHSEDVDDELAALFRALG